MEFRDSDTGSFETDNDSADLDFQPNSESDFSSNSTLSETDQSTFTSDANIDIDVAVYGDVLDDTARHDLSLKMISKRKSNSKIWSYFGNLLYKRVLISKVSDKLYCKICFNAGNLKRYLPTHFFVT